VGARLLAGAAPLKLAEGGGTADLRGGWDWVRFRCGIEEKTENDSGVSLCGGSHGNFGRKLTEAHFAPLFSFVCSMGFRWLFMFGKLVLKACCLLPWASDFFGAEADRKLKAWRPRRTPSATARRHAPRAGARRAQDSARGQGAKPGDLGVHPPPRRAATLLASGLSERGGGVGAPVTAAQRLPERVGGCPGPEDAAGGGEGEHGLGWEQAEHGQHLVVAQLRDGSSAMRTLRHPWAHRRLSPLDRHRIPSPPKFLAVSPPLPSTTP
jgi:hypothetical protein